MMHIYKRNIYKNFLICFLKVTLIFFVTIIVMNLFEEINFLKELNNDFILLFPFCSKKLPQKKWPYFKELIIRLKKDYKNAEKYFERLNEISK